MVARMRIVWLVVGLLALGVAVMTGAAVGAYYWLRSSAIAAREGGPPSPAASTAPGGGPAAPGGSADPYGIVDWRHVDPQELLAPARKLAQAIEPTSELRPLMPMMALGDLTGGTIDLTVPTQRVIIDYDFYVLDASKPPGSDLREGVIRVTAQRGQMRAKSEGTGAVRYPGYSPPKDPTCRVKDAWKAVVATGVPANTIAHLTISTEHSFSDSAQLTWSFHVLGHDEWNRLMDAYTCERVR